MRLLILSCVIFLSCFLEEEDMIGTYAPVNYKNNFDTIRLQEKGIYSRKVYDKKGVLLLNMRGEWQHNRNTISFHSFFLNLDDDLVEFPYLVQDTDTYWSGYLENSNGNLEFCMGYLAGSLPDQNCYRKIKND